MADMEDCDTDNTEALTYKLKLQQTLQAQLTDLEACSRRNNIRIHGIPEGPEGDNMKTFLEEFFKSELFLPDTPVWYSTCHRSQGPRPPQGANHRSVLICFLECTTKELVLHSAWRKKMTNYSGKRVFFEQDHPAEIIAKR